MPFLEVALRNAGRNYRIIPIKPGEKRPFLMDWPNLATADEAQIRAWAAKWPDYNCGVAGGGDVIILDTDRLDRLQEVCGAQWAAWSDTYSVGRGDPNRLHLYYRATEEVLAWGNKRWKEAGHDGNVFEIKGRGAQVVAEGSVHASGGVYAITRDVPLIPFPPAMFHLLKDWWSKQNPTGKREWTGTVHDGEGRDDFLTSEAGKLRAMGFGQDAILARLSEINEERCIPPKPITDLERIAKSAARYDVPAPAPQVRIGTASTTPEAAPLTEGKRPVYPISVWDGTAAGEFAKICTHDNNIPRKFFVEAWNTILGAVVGDRLTVPKKGGIPRSYTFLILKAGKGKGTVIRDAVGFWKASWASPFVSVMPGFLRGEQDFMWKSKGVGARNASASSGPGMTRLIQDNKKTPPQLTWQGTIPRIISVHEEAKTFLSALFIEGGTGTNLDGVICQLWDDVEFAAPGTGTRQALYGEMMFSMLCGITEEDWFDLLSKGDVVGGGLMSRLNIIGSLGEYDNVSAINPHDFLSLQKRFLPRIEKLIEEPCVLAPTEGALRVMAEWHLSLPEDAVRANVRAWRSALLLSFLRQEDTISEKTALDATLLGDYQRASHLYYTVTKADNPLANVQHKILRALEMKGPLKKGRLQDYTHARRVGTELWNRAMEGLVRDGKVGKREDGTYYLAVSQ